MKPRSLTPGVLALALVGGWLALRPTAADTAAETALARGRAHVEKTCSGCHSDVALDAAVKSRLHGGADALDAFLAKHFAEDSALRADVVAYLQARVAAASDDS